MLIGCVFEVWWGWAAMAARSYRGAPKSQINENIAKTPNLCASVASPIYELRGVTRYE